MLGTEFACTIMSLDSQKASPRVLYLTEWFDPEPVAKGLRFARALAEQGRSVEVATAFPNYPGGKIYNGYSLRAYQRELMDGIPIHRLFVCPSHDMSSLRRMATFVSFFVSSLIFCLLRMRRYDVVYVYHPPIMPALAAALAGMIHRVPFTLEIQDLWPDSVASSGMGQPWLVRLLNLLCDFTYRRAAKIVCQSNGMAERLVERGVDRSKIVTIYNWSNYVASEDDESAATFPISLKEHFNNRVNLVYGGNLGQAQALDQVIEAAAVAARQVPNIRVHLFGSGVECEQLAVLAAKHAPDHVMIHVGVAPRVMDRIFDQADALVIHLKEDPLYEITIPSKMQHYLSAGKPIVGAISGEAARLLRKSGAAEIVAPGDSRALANTFIAVAEEGSSARTARGARGREFYSKHFDFSVAIERTRQILDEARRSP